MRLPRRERTSGGAAANRPLVYRSVGALFLAAIALAVGAGLLLDALLHDPGREAVTVVAAFVLGAAVVFALAVRPAVFATETGLVLRNPLRDVAIPWSSVQDIRLGLSLDVRADGRWHHSFAVQASPQRQRRDARQAMRNPDRTGSSWADRVHRELLDLWGRRAADAAVESRIRVRWSALVLGWIGLGAALLVLGLVLR